MPHIRKFVFLTLAPLLIAATISARSEPLSSNVIERVKVAAGAAAGSCVQASNLRDMAVNAVRNAMAAEDQAQEVFLKAVKTGDKKNIAAAKKTLADVNDAVEDAREMAEIIADNVEAAKLSAETAKNCEKNLTAVVSKREAESLVKKAEKAADSTARITQKIQVLAEELKKKWLIAVPVAPTTGSDTGSTSSSGIR